MEVHHVPIIFALLALVLCVAAFAGAAALGLAPLTWPGIALYLGALLFAAILTWPVAWLLTLVIHFLQPDQRAPSTRYSIDQAREPGREDDNTD